MNRLGLALVLIFLLGGASAGQDTLYLRIKESEVRPPQGVAPGQYRRIVQPFSNWTLICDENLQDRTRICNVTQSIVDQADRQVFSWSVAATQEGQPFMILRAMPGLGPDGAITLSIPDGGNPVRVTVEGCNDIVCVGTVPIGPRLRPQVAGGGVIGISYATAAGETIAISAPLAGIEDALTAIE